MQISNATSSSVLTEALCGLLDRDLTLQRHVLQHVTALACPFNTSTSCADARMAPPLWSYPAGHPPYPHEIRQDEAPQQRVCATTCDEPREEWSSVPSALGPIDMILVLDIYEVAHASPGTCAALLNAPCAAVDASAAAAVQEWLHCYAHRQYTQKTQEDEYDGGGDRNADRAMEHAPLDEAAVSQPPWPAVWWSALEARQVECILRVLLLRMPSVYTLFTSAGEAGCSSLVRQHSPLTPLPRGSTDAYNSGSFADLSSISPLPTEDGQVQSLCLSPSSAWRSSVSSLASGCLSSACLSYPSDGFLEVAPEVHIVGVVHQIYFQHRSADFPAPWIVLWLLCPHATTPVRRVVDLTALRRRTVNLVAVIGAVVEVRGHAQVARRQASKCGGETLLDEYVVASWATTVTQSPFSENEREEEEEVYTARMTDAPATSFVSPATPTAAVPVTAELAAFASPLRFSSLDREQTMSVLDKGVTGCDIEFVAGLSSWDEERAARVALRCWEGARLALGVTCDDAGKTTSTTSSFFSTTLDVVVAAQLALHSAQMRDGVVLLLVDEAVDALVTQMVKALRRVAPTATLELPSLLLCRAPPSSFLPSYRVQRVPPSSLTHPQRTPPTSTAAVNATATAAATTCRGMPPPAARRAQQRTRVTGFAAATAATSAAPPPPEFPEVVSGGALTRASGRALVLQGVETMPATTLKVLQEALRTVSSEDGDVGVLPSAVSDAGGGSGDVPFSEERFCSSHSSVTTAKRFDACRARSVGARHVIQREGGQLVGYRVAHAALCSVRRGARLAEKSYLFEFAQRCDVVLRPAYDRQRQAAAVHAGVEPIFRHLLQSRQETWLRFLGRLCALPATLEEVGGDGVVAELTPTVSEPCNRLLSTYFVAAKALCRDGTDASMMTTLVKLTTTHAQWRCRLTRLQGRCGRAGRASRGTQQSSASALERSAATATALIDAVVAVGLCDATLHFFTAKTLLGECVFRLLEREAWPMWEAEAEERAALRELRPHQARDSSFGVNEDDGQHSWSAPPCLLTGVSTEVQELYGQVEFRTRLDVGDLHGCNDAPAVSAFSIQQLVQDLINHLERVTQKAASSAES